MKRFDLNAHCDKCGGTDIGTYYCNGLTSYGLACTHTEGFDKNHMVRTCRTCRYAWTEAPLDAEPEGQVAAA